MQNEYIINKSKKGALQGNKTQAVLKINEFKYFKSYYILHII